MEHRRRGADLASGSEELIIPPRSYRPCEGARLRALSDTPIVEDRFAVRIGHGNGKHGALSGTELPDQHSCRSRRRGDDLQPRHPLNLLKDRVGWTTRANLEEHGVRHDDFGYPSAEQFELPNFGEQDQGRGTDDSPERRCPDSSSSFSSSMVTWHAGTFARNKASRKSARLNPAISAPLPCEIMPRSFQKIAAASRSSRANCSSESPNGSAVSSGSSMVIVLMDDLLLSL